RLSRPRRRHPFCGVFRRYPAKELALIEFSRNDRAKAVAIGRRGGFLVQPQIGLSLRCVGTVALVALVRKNRPDVAIELDGGGVRVCRRPVGNRQKQKHYPIHASAPVTRDPGQRPPDSGARCYYKGGST